MAQRAEITSEILRPDDRPPPTLEGPVTSEDVEANLEDLQNVIAESGQAAVGSQAQSRGFKDSVKEHAVEDTKDVIIERWQRVS